MSEPTWRELFTPGANCWRVEHADRVTVRHESSCYFEALTSASENARHTILIVGWDFDRQERIGRDADAPTFESFFCELLEQRPELQVWLLSWDYNFIYAREREWFQDQRLQHLAHERFNAWFDGAHPVTASQHQKFVVIDDQLAFIGGIDLSRWRWDTAEHAAEDDRRTNPDGERYPPFHDLMLQVEGAPARALGELARQRWAASGAPDCPPGMQEKDAREDVSGERGDDHENRRADPQGQEKTDPGPSRGLSWPKLEVAFSRTMPAYRDQRAVREVEQLYLDSFRAARDYIYIENQYLTSRTLCTALQSVLEAPEGPELIMVLPELTGGWLEQVSMGELRRRRVAALRDSDRFDRLRIYYPHQPGLPEDECIMVHAKLMLADDCFLRIGSANTSNRSMGLDSECDAAIVDKHHGAARVLLHRLLAEHLDVTDEQVAQARKDTEGLIAAVESLQTEAGRSLRTLQVPERPNGLALQEEEQLVDPDEPIDAKELVKRAVPTEEKNTGSRRLYLFLGFVVLLLALAATWRWTPLSEWVDADRLADGLALFDDALTRFLVVTAAIALTTLAMMPLTVLVVASALLLGPGPGFIAAMVGALVSAALAFLVGKRTGGKLLQRYGESRVHQISERLSDQGIVAVAILRLMPVAPYTIVNVVAGASHLTLYKFLIGSFLGLLPGMAALTFFSGSLLQAVREPSPLSVAVLGFVAVLIAAGAWMLRRMLRN